MRSRFLLVCLLSAACSADGESARTMRVSAATGVSPGAGTARMYINSFDNSIPDNFGDAWPSERLQFRLDGAVAMVPGLDGAEYPAPVGDMAFDVPAGEYLIELTRANGTVVASASVDLGAGTHNEMVVYGSLGQEKRQVFLDVLGGLSPGQVRARVVNVMKSKAPVDVLSCAQNQFGCPGGLTEATCHDAVERGCGYVSNGSECTVLKAGLAYGETFAVVVSEGTDVRASVASPTGTGTVEMDLPENLYASPAFGTVYPYHLWSADSYCPNWPQAIPVFPGWRSPTGE